MKKSREACPHDVDLGPLMTDSEITVQVSNAREHPAIRAILQAMRTKSFSMGRDGRTIPAGTDPGDFRAFHDGCQEGLEEFFWELVEMRKTELDKELEEGEETSEEAT